MAVGQVTAALAVAEAVSRPQPLRSPEPVVVSIRFSGTPEQALDLPVAQDLAAQRLRAFTCSGAKANAVPGPGDADAARGSPRHSRLPPADAERKRTKWARRFEPPPGPVIADLLELQEIARS
jgi:hypothetical protein